MKKMTKAPFVVVVVVLVGAIAFSGAQILRKQATYKRDEATFAALQQGLLQEDEQPAAKGSGHENADAMMSKEAASNVAPSISDIDKSSNADAVAVRAGGASVAVDVANTVNTVGEVNASIAPAEAYGDSLRYARYMALKQQNDDFAAWICIPNTVINYPVMHTPQQEDYYIDKDFYRAKSEYGVPFLAAVCDIYAPSTNLLVHGHHMKNKQMFGALEQYADKAFYDAHRFIEFDTLQRMGTYEIIAVFRTTLQQNHSRFYPYYEFIQAENAHDFESFVRTVQNMALYDTGVTATYGDELLTLSTCEYTMTDGRLVVVAKRVEQ